MPGRSSQPFGLSNFATVNLSLAVRTTGGNYLAHPAMHLPEVLPHHMRRSSSIPLLENQRAPGYLRDEADNPPP